MERGAPPAGERCGGRRARRHAGRRLVGMAAQRGAEARLNGRTRRKLTGA